MNGFEAISGFRCCVIDSNVHHEFINDLAWYANIPHLAFSGATILRCFKSPDSALFLRNGYSIVCNMKIKSEIRRTLLRQLLVDTDAIESLKSTV